MVNRNLIEIREKCSEEEFIKYRKGTGYVMGYLQTEFMNPIYEEHPELMPKELGGSYELDTSSYDELFKLITRLSN